MSAEAGLLCCAAVFVAGVVLIAIGIVRHVDTAISELFGPEDEDGR